MHDDLVKIREIIRDHFIEPGVSWQHYRQHIHCLLRKVTRFPLFLPFPLSLSTSLSLSLILSLSSYLTISLFRAVMYPVIKKRNCFWESTFVGVENYQSICVSSTLQLFFLWYLSLSYNSVCYMRTCRLGSCKLYSCPERKVQKIEITTVPVRVSHLLLRITTCVST